MIFEVAVIFLALLWALSLWFFLNYSKRQRELAAQQAQGDALRDQRIKDLAKRLDDYQNGTVRMGEAIHELRAVVAPLPEKLQQLEQRDPNSVTLAQAAKLVGMGASVEELTQTCGLTQAEAQLMSKLHRGE